MNPIPALILIGLIAGCTAPGAPPSAPGGPPAAPAPPAAQSPPLNGSAQAQPSASGGHEAWDGQASLILGPLALTDDGHQLSLANDTDINVTVASSGGLAISVTLDLQLDGRSALSSSGPAPLTLHGAVKAGSYAVLIRGALPPTLDAAAAWSYHAEAAWTR